MTSAIPGSIDYLLGLATQSVKGIGEAVVADGWTDERSSVMVGVGIASPPFFDGDQSETTGSPQWVGMPADLYEEFIIPGYIYVGRGGTDNSSVRTEAFAIWDVFEPLLRADLTLGGLVYVAEIATFNVRSPRAAEEAEGGRYCLIQFGIRGKNLA